MRYEPQSNSGVFGRLDDLHMRKSECMRVNAYIHDGEVIAELSSRVLAGVRSGIDALARDLKAAFAKPTRH